jgi:aerobic carbon-monoxide dehydrogenase small subunit
VSTHPITLTVNGKLHQQEVEARALLAHHLRDSLRLTSVHIGCDTSQCGACTVQLNGRAVKSCTVFAVQANGSTVDTIDGLATEGVLHPLQASFQAYHALQCGFCTPGMIMSSIELLRQNPNPSEEEVRDWLKGNFCRCTGYQHIIAAIQEAAPQLASDHTTSTTTAPAHVQKEVICG